MKTESNKKASKREACAQVTENKAHRGTWQKTQKNKQTPQRSGQKPGIQMGVVGAPPTLVVT